MSIGVKKTKSVILPEYNNNLIRAILGIKTGERELPPLKADQVLVKMEAAPCNPSDIAFIRGGYNIKKPVPAVPGFEGAGIVVETGSDSSALLGKRVSGFIQAEVDGTWAEFFIVNEKDCILLKEGLDIEQGACLSINPFTAYGLVEIATDFNCKAVVQNAAGGQVAEFIRVFASLNGIEVINIVRKPDQVSVLKDKGIEYVLDSTSNTFAKDLHFLTNSLNATIAFDAVGGEMTGLLISGLPPSSRVIVYGGLSGATLDKIDPMDIIFKAKQLEGFNLNDWIASKPKKEFESIGNKIQDLILEGKMGAKIQDSYNLNDAANGIRNYIKSMSSGKILFKP